MADLWNYQREEGGFAEIPEGRHRVRIRKVEKAQSKAGNNMLVIELDVSGQTGTLWHYITFMQDKPEITNRMLTQFFDSFKDIADGDFNGAHWIGKVGAVMVKHDEQGRAKVHYFIKADKQGDLAPWKEPGKNTGTDGFMKIPEGSQEDLPFF